MPEMKSGAAAIIYYKLPDDHLYHWVIDAHGEKDTVESLKLHLAKWIPGAVFVDARIEKWNIVNRDTVNYHDQLRWADYLTKDATRIETSDGHQMSCLDNVWYAYPKADRPPRLGAVVIRDDEGAPKKYRSAIAAYQACLEASGYYDKLAQAERRTETEVPECSAAL